MDIWRADGRSPTRPASEGRGSGRADGRRAITGHQRTHRHADAHDIATQKPGARTAPAPTSTPSTARGPAVSVARPRRVPRP
eukprot:3799287-Prymnesium_polylepis.1